MTTTTTAWPDFATDAWDATRPTLHRFAQIVGKTRLALAVPLNHYWHSTLYVSARGLTTSAIPYKSDAFEVEFDFVNANVRITTSWGPIRSVALEGRSVATFYADYMSALRDLDIEVFIWKTPVEIEERTPFDKDTQHATYDPRAAEAFWRALLQVDRVFTQFRGRFLGKCSPVHFFWGAFDLAVTRFSGRRAPAYTGTAPFVNAHVMHASYSHEVCSAGFWAGADGVPPMFYVYAVPEPDGFKQAIAQPHSAHYDAAMGEFLLPYAEVRSAEHPDSLLLDFLQSTYDAAATLGKWDRVLLEQEPACACTPAQIAALHGAPHVH